MISSVSMMSMAALDVYMVNHWFGLIADMLRKNYYLCDFFELNYGSMMANEITLHD